MHSRYFIDVGGVIFATTRSTLSKCPALDRMMKEHDGVKEQDKAPLFVDRDGYYFQYVLNFLRNNSIASIDASVVEALLNEAAFFKLKEMERQLTELQIK